MATKSTYDSQQPDPVQPSLWQAVIGTVIFGLLTIAVAVVAIVGRANSQRSIMLMFGYPTTIAYMLILLVLRPQRTKTAKALQQAIIGFCVSVIAGLFTAWMLQMLVRS